jgi:hypothetical protein
VKESRKDEARPGKSAGFWRRTGVYENYARDRVERRRARVLEGFESFPRAGRPELEAINPIFFRFASAISGGSFDNCPSTTSAIISSVFSKLVFFALLICRCPSH